MPARDFDELLPDDHTFDVRGETFTYLDVKPSVIDELQEIGANANGKDIWEVQDEQIKFFLTPESQKQWDEMRKRTMAEGPITPIQHNAIFNWLFEVSTGRPLVQESPSDNGPGSTEVTSTEPSTAPTTKSRPKSS